MTDDQVQSSRGFARKVDPPEVLLRRGATGEFSPAFYGERGVKPRHVASATIESVFQPSLTRRCWVELALIPALKGRAKFKTPLRGEDKVLPGFLEKDFSGKPVQSFSLVDHEQPEG